MKSLILKIGLALFAVLFVVVLVFCVVLNPSSDIVSRTESPDGNFIVLIEETNGGTAKGFGYNVLVEPKEASNSRVLVAKFFEAKRNQSAYGVNAIWLSPRRISILYLNAPWASVLAPDVKCGNAVIHVEAHSGVVDALAPPGGMQHNLDIEKKKELFGGGK